METGEAIEEKWKQMTSEEYKARLDKAEDDYLKGKIIEQSDLEKEFLKIYYESSIGGRTTRY